MIIPNFTNILVDILLKEVLSFYIKDISKEDFKYLTDLITKPNKMLERSKERPEQDNRLLQFCFKKYLNEDMLLDVGNLFRLELIIIAEMINTNLLETEPVASAYLEFFNLFDQIYNSRQSIKDLKNSKDACVKARILYETICKFHNAEPSKYARFIEQLCDMSYSFPGVALEK